MSQHPKIVIIGAGSLFFGRKLIWAMNRLPGLVDGHLALVDTDKAHLDGMEKLAHVAKEASGAGHTISAHSDFREALPGADFVVLSFAKDNAHYRGVDVQISAECGIRMCSGDTIGPGGVFRALREFPEIMEIADAVTELCPEAWLINYINPSAVFGIALSKYFKGKSLALCDSLHLPYLWKNYLQMIGREDTPLEDFHMRIAGVNHFTWMLEARIGEEDVLPLFREATRKLGEDEDPNALAKAVFNKKIGAQLADVFGPLPVCIAHTKEYVPFYQGYGPFNEQEHVPELKLFEHETRQEITRSMWKEVAAYGSGEKSGQEFLEKYTSDHATDIIHALCTDSGQHFFINLPNSGAVPNLPDDAILELECVVKKSGPEPVSCPEMPLGLRGLQMQILDTHELTVEAFMKKDRNLLIRALATDPIVNSLAAAEEVAKRLYEAEKDVLPDWVAPKDKATTAAPQKVYDTVEQGQTREGS